uniref:Aquaporin n=1 Tax=Ditylum brightwellii TaxID=49249 RepID=A0A7S4STA8_9STRA|mmetsp:Transcript_2383/g.3183  ORF Transcript_2383/g.3183 Transcript_2383/m.3183 type:complete len:329 (+) Transcript_2383:1-987(+)
MRVTTASIIGGLACLFANFHPVALAFAPLQPSSPNLHYHKNTQRALLSSSGKPLPSPTLVRAEGGEQDVESSSKSTLLREAIAEFIGTFVIVHIGCGTVCAAIYKSAQVGLWQIAAAWSIAVTIAITTTGHVSGAHLNPAVSIALAALRPSPSFGWGKVIPYCAAQISGAAAAAGVNFVLYRDAIAKFEAAEGIVRGAAGSVASAAAFGEYWSVPCWATALLAESMGTAMLAFVIFSLTNPKNSSMKDNSGWIPPLIGATVGGLISVFAPLTQAGFNPARDFGPRIITALTGWGRAVAMKGWWVYVLGPILGALTGAFIADKILYADD